MIIIYKPKDRRFEFRKLSFRNDFSLYVQAIELIRLLTAALIKTLIKI